MSFKSSLALSYPHVIDIILKLFCKNIDIYKTLLPKALNCRKFLSSFEGGIYKNLKTQSENKLKIEKHSKLICSGVFILLPLLLCQRAKLAFIQYLKNALTRIDTIK